MKQRERRVAEMAPEACVAAAKLLRDGKRDLGSDRQRQLAEEMAVGFDAQVAETARPASS
jgi:hypothetical protein